MTIIPEVMSGVEQSSTSPEKPQKLQGRELFKTIGCPKTIVAPMVDQSELAWRIISRRYGAELCYTPMFHARLFGESEQYRKDQFNALDGDPEVDRPLVVQFCANDPQELLTAARHVVGRCDAVDLNIGCPQGIARRGKYGAFLMDDWDLIYKLINILHTELDIPVTAKIRIYEDREKTLAYAKHVLSAGAQFLTVHGRTREMKGQKTGLADWSMIRYLRDNLPPDTVMFANGNILYPEDIGRCLEATNTDAVMSAEGNLYNPGVFNTKKEQIDDQYPRVDKILREYFEVAKSTPGNASKSAMKSHFFKVLRPFLAKHIDIRNQIGPIKKGQFEEYEKIVEMVEERVAQIYEAGEEADVVVDNGEYKEIPHWRCQPYFRVVNGVASNGKRKEVDEETIVEDANKKSKAE
ncbi:tRNA-dihydrouridine(16/17) synthase [NAD(P)(+)] [Trichomonascus vanleenenianus]|uniref:tRNA dihydrouridine synthase n=1 Tax=Trichomonascus vanleenenianus TaxID=2268995 RepID=UPI003ECB5CF4